MEEGRRSDDPSGFVVKKKSSSGCLIVRKKGSDGVGRVCPGSHKGFEPKKEMKRPRMELSESVSTDEPLMSARRRVFPETLRACNGLSVFDKGGSEEYDTGRKRGRGEDIRHNGDGMIARNREKFSERKRNGLDALDFDEYDGNAREMMRRKRFDDGEIDQRRYFGSMGVERSEIERDLETGSSRHALVDSRKSSYFQRIRGLSRGGGVDRDGAPPPISVLRDKYDSDEIIRIQGKNGVLRVMINKKKKIGGSLNSYDQFEVEENRRGLRIEDTKQRDLPIHPSFYSKSKSVEKASSSVRGEKSPMNFLKPLSTKDVGVTNVDLEDSDTLLKLRQKNAQARGSMRTPLLTKSSRGPDVDSEDSNTSLKLGSKNKVADKSSKQVSSGGTKTPCNQISPTRIKEGKVKRGTGTEKQKLRERIREMLLNAGWTIDYRPRRNRDYLDAVYMSPSGTAYWSIIKAYEALLKQSNDKEDGATSGGDGSQFTPLSDEVLRQLTRNTRNKIEKEMKKKKKKRNGKRSDSVKDGRESDNVNETATKKSPSTRYDEESSDSGSHEEK